MEDKNRRFLRETREKIFSSQERFLHPLESVRRFTDAIDELLILLAGAYLPAQLDQDSWCVAAVGGYGRRELCPYSDVDILILYKGAAAKPPLSRLVTALWDCGFAAGVVVRTIAECKSILGNDLATDLAFLDLRRVAGSPRLFHRLFHSVVVPWFGRRKKQYVRLLHDHVRERVLSRQTSVYRVEPDLKEGICALRDCHRIIWCLIIERRLQVRAPRDLLDVFRQTDGTLFLAGYSFLLGLRIELHMTYGRRMDVLEAPRQSEIAGKLAIGKHDASALMEKYFENAAAIRNLALLFLEHTLHPESLFTRIRRGFGGISPVSDLIVADGILFLRNRCRGETHPAPEWFLRVFLSAAIHRASLSVGLRNFIRISLALHGPRDFVFPEAMGLFRQILAIDAPAGEVMSEMHETGLLEKLVPEFIPLVRKVEFDTYHEYPVDEHTLLMLKTLDGADDEDPLVRDVIAAIPDRGVLRLVFLLHDIGKGMEGDHSRNGAILSQHICDRIGFSDAQKDLVCFLVSEHLSLSDFSFAFNLKTDEITSYAGDIGNISRLEYLFTLTWFDIKCVSAKALSGWKKKLLKDLFLALRRKFLEQPVVHHEEEFAAQRARVVEKDDIVFDLEQFEGFERLLVASFDRKGFLADLVACITSEGYDILAADAHTFPDSRIVDILQLQPDQTTFTLPAERLANIRNKWKALSMRSVSATDLVRERERRYPRKKIRPLSLTGAIEITLDNKRSPVCSVLQITMPDSFGLLYKITGALVDLGCTIISARLATKIDRAADTFYILSAENKKIESGRDEMIEYLRQSLQTALPGQPP